jgi:hypothetical protein
MPTEPDTRLGSEVVASTFAFRDRASCERGQAAEVEVALERV